MSKSKTQIKVGDKVAYSKKWLQATFTHTGPLPRARGDVTRIISLGREPNATRLAEVTWDRPDVPDKVNVANLVLVKHIPFEI